MSKESQNPTPNATQDNDDMVHIDFDFDVRFYASPQAKQLLQWLSQALKWLFPFLVAVSTMRSADVGHIQSPQLPDRPSTEIQQNLNVNR